MMRKNYFLAVWFCVLAIPAFAQQPQQVQSLSGASSPAGCITEVTPQQISMEMARDHEAYEAFTQSLINNAPEVTKEYVIQLHLLRNDDGSNSSGVTVAQIRSEIANYVNPYFNTATLNATFVECGPEIYHNSTAYNSLSSTTEGDNMASAYNSPNVINLYFVDYAQGYCGWANFPSYLPKDYIVLAYGCATNQSTLVHELGHYFDVYHTHETAFGTESVTRTTTDPCYDCGVDGDLLCDTDADPNISGNVYGNTCGFVSSNGNGPCGLPYTPDPNNIMSYSAKACRTVFTLGQQGRMAAAMATSRSYLNSTGCLVPTCSIASIAAGAQTPCASNLYSQEIVVTYANPPASGTLDVNGQSFAITSSPQTVTLTNLVADGNAVNVTAAFSADLGCTMTSNSLFTAPAPCTPAAGLSLYGTDGFTGNLVEIDVTTGNGTVVGPTGLTSIGLAHNPNTNVTYLRDFSSLYTVDLTTAAVTLVGSSGSGITALTFDMAFSTLYSINQGSGSVYTVDPATGTATLIGNTGISTPLALATASNGTLWAGGINGGIYSINTSTGAATLVWPGAITDGITSMAVHPTTGKCYVVTLSGDYLVEFDLSTGVASTIGGYVGAQDIRGLSFVGAGNPCPTMTLTMGTKGVRNQNFAMHGAGDDMTYYNGISAAKGFDVCVAGGVGPYTAVWSSTDGTISQYDNRCDITGGSKASVIYPTGAFDVSVTVTDANGCSATETMSIGYVDYICSAPGTLWDYLLCEVGTGITSCVPTTSAASAMLATGLYELGSCAPKTGLEAAALSFAVYPSPTNGMATLRYNAVKNTSAQINVLDLNGRVIQSSSIELNKGNVEYGLDLSNVTNGVYFVQLVTENDVQTQRIQVLK